ncbi:hypothetical protein GGF44_002547, partial [Coemansia sp. RSA 1694]
NKRSRLNASRDSERQQEAGPSQKRTRSRRERKEQKSPSADPEHTAAPGAMPSSTNTERACGWQVEFERHAAMFVSHLDKVDEAAMDDDTWQEHFSSVLATKAMQLSDGSGIGYGNRRAAKTRVLETAQGASPAGLQPEKCYELERDHPELMTTPVKLKQPWVPDGHMKQRVLAYEHTINHYFVAEIAPVIKAILNAKWPEARFEVIEGSPNGHADLFLRVRIKKTDDLWVYSSVAVELKRPYGTDHEESAIASRKKWPKWMRDAEMPNDKVAEHTPIAFVYAYILNEILTKMEANK